LAREKQERVAVERQLAERDKEMGDVQSKFDAYKAESSAR